MTDYSKISQSEKDSIKLLGPNSIVKRLKDACKLGELDIIRYILKSSDLAVNPNINPNNNTKNNPFLTIATMYGQLDVINYLLTSPEAEGHIQITDSLLSIAAQNGHLNVIKFLLTHPVLKHQIDIHATYKAPIGNDFHDTGENVIINAISSNELEILQYVTSSSDILTKINLNDDTNYFYKACEQGYYNQDFSIVDWMIFDYKVKIPQTTRDYWKDDEIISQKIITRDRHDTLNNILKLKDNTIITHQNKI